MYCIHHDTISSSEFAHLKDVGLKNMSKTNVCGTNRKNPVSYHEVFFQ